MHNVIIGYTVDARGNIVKRYNWTQAKAARRYVDKLDNAHGGYIARCTPIFVSLPYAD